MLYRKNTLPQCATCVHAVKIGKIDMLCRRHGVVYVEYHCRRYRYDPLKRMPVRTPPIPTGKDYTI